ncbi:hypothetical protein ABW07_19090 [Pluralibacter gergoviae]|nr:hypothetical protein ABW07_19090 [Pluralibacter gergoviae]
MCNRKASDINDDFEVKFAECFVDFNGFLLGSITNSLFCGSLFLSRLTTPFGTVNTFHCRAVCFGCFGKPECFLFSAECFFCLGKGISTLRSERTVIDTLLTPCGFKVAV